MPDLLGPVVNVLHVLVKCSQCLRIVRLSGEEHIDEDGDRYVEAAPVYQAMALHKTRGCPAKQRR